MEDQEQGRGSSSEREPNEEAKAEIPARDNKAWMRTMTTNRKGDGNEALRGSVGPRNPGRSGGGQETGRLQAAGYRPGWVLSPLSYRTPEKRVWGKGTGPGLSTWSLAWNCRAGGWASGCGARGRRPGLEADIRESWAAAECIEVKEMAQKRAEKS